MSFSNRLLLISGFYFLLGCSFLVSSWMIFVNLEEIIQKSLGFDTVFAKMPWNNDREAFLFSGLLTVLYISLIGVTLKFLKSWKKKWLVLLNLIGLIVSVLFYLCTSF